MLGVQKIPPWSRKKEHQAIELSYGNTELSPPKYKHSPSGSPRDRTCLSISILHGAAGILDGPRGQATPEDNPEQLREAFQGLGRTRSARIRAPKSCGFRSATRRRQGERRRRGDDDDDERKRRRRVGSDRTFEREREQGQTVSETTRTKSDQDAERPKTRRRKRCTQHEVWSWRGF